MKKSLFFIASVFLSVSQLSGQITMPGVKWSDSYSFDRCNIMKIDFFAKNNELMRTFNYKTFYTSGGKNFMVIMDAPAKGSDITTIFDLANEVAIQIMGSDSPEPMYNATRFKYPEGADIKKLELKPTEETRTIVGHLCKKFTYTYKSIFGSVWITDEVKLSNDTGIFRAAKMSALHNTLSIEGFVMEMTSEDSRGGKTVMTTVTLDKSENKTIDLPRAKMGTSMNKVSYYTF
jgi:hypothetical protein